MICPHCKNDDESMIERSIHIKFLNGVKIRLYKYFCRVCSKEWTDEIKENK